MGGVVKRAAARSLPRGRSCSVVKKYETVAYAIAKSAAEKTICADNVKRDNK
jgi:hypothetical protein